MTGTQGVRCCPGGCRAARVPDFQAGRDRRAARHRYPVCVECKQRINTCVMDMGILCLGPITRAGCNAVCPRNRAGCWGCRGPTQEANYESLAEILQEHGFSQAHIAERVSFFNAFIGNQVLPTLRSSQKSPVKAIKREF